MILRILCQAEDHNSIRQHPASFSLNAAKSAALCERERAYPSRGEKNQHRELPQKNGFLMLGL